VVYGELEKDIGHPTATVVNPVTNTVATTVTQVFRNNPNRIFWLLTNLGAAVLYLGWDRAVSSARGLQVQPNGGALSLAWREDYELCFAEVFCLSSSGNLTVYCFELNILEAKPKGGA